MDVSSILKRRKLDEPVVYPPAEPIGGVEEPKDNKKERRIIKPKMLEKFDEEMKK